MGEGQDTLRTSEIKPATFIAKVLEEAKDGTMKIEQRNKFVLGDTLEVLSPEQIYEDFTITSIINLDGQTQESAPHPKQELIINCPYPLKKGDMLRKNQQ